jgi:hypothetical protein
MSNRKRFTVAEPVLRKATTPMTRAELECEFEKQLESDLMRQRQIIAEWSQKLLVNNCHSSFAALCWSQNMWQAVARLELLVNLKEAVQSRGWAALQAVHDDWARHLKHMTRSLTNTSSSQTHNLANTFLVEALAQLLDVDGFGRVYSPARWKLAPEDAEAAEGQRQRQQAEYDSEFATSHAQWREAKAAFKAARN